MGRRSRQALASRTNAKVRSPWKTKAPPAAAKTGRASKVIPPTEESKSAEAARWAQQRKAAREAVHRRLDLLELNMLEIQLELIQLQRLQKCVRACAMLLSSRSTAPMHRTTCLAYASQGRE